MSAPHKEKRVKCENHPLPCVNSMRLKSKNIQGGQSRMTIYLIIITTVLVLTQIVRLIQNAIQLKQMGTRVSTNNETILRVYKKLEKWLDKEGEGE
jgi:hypothetical protein